MEYLNKISFVLNGDYLAVIVFFGALIFLVIIPNAWF